MQTIILSDASGATAPQSEPAFVSRAMSVLAGAARSIRAHLEIKRAERRLLGMSDRDLKDIGLTRVQIFSAVRHPE